MKTVRHRVAPAYLQLIIASCRGRSAWLEIARFKHLSRAIGMIRPRSQAVMSRFETHLDSWSASTSPARLPGWPGPCPDVPSGVLQRSDGPIRGRLAAGLSKIPGARTAVAAHPQNDGSDAGLLVCGGR